MGNAPEDKRVSEIVLKRIVRKPTAAWCEHRHGGIESQLNVRSNNFLGQFVGTDSAFKSSDGAIKIPFDVTRSITNGYPALLPARKMVKK